ncbi:FAD-binding oxidoreductase [Streptomyces abyssomicinicus]|uniref:FAD-binding oxidoreductase n=1 Tax=Streptomyces abyssomicinicus TaxID=574929 RepID=UPI001FE9F221|nr:FAD-binding oxidoreductase [Streptomyces abyssomicinicus]
MGTEDSNPAEVPASAVEALRSTLRGALLLPGDAEYASARQLWNGMIDRRPALVARCESDDDVAAAVRFARDHGLPLSVRGGGHGVAGLALCDGGLVVDLSRMTAVEVDAGARTARAQGGCTLGHVDRATQPHGLAAPLGVVSETGIAGLTLSGGMGWLRRAHGLSCDALLSATVVTADGEVRTVDADHHPDLFWAIRGGGGNFGVVTSFAYRLFPVGPEVYLCNVYYPARHAREVLRACESHLAATPDGGLAPLGVFGRVPADDELPAGLHGEPFVALLALHPGDPAEGESALRPLREITEPLFDLSGVTTYLAAQSLLDEDYPDGDRYYWKSVSLPGLGDEMIGRLADHAARAPSPASTVDVWFQGGAMARGPEQETAFTGRHAPYLIGIEGNWSDAADSERNIAWVRDTFAALRTFSDGGIYLNFPGFLEEGEQLVRESFGANYERLAAVKAAYDPGNLFRHNPNILPKA